MLSKALNFCARSRSTASRNARFFAAASQECLDHLKRLGIRNKQIVFNPTVSELYEYALLPEHLTSRGDPTVYPTSISDTGALSVSSGSKTGRTPKEKRVVLDATTKDKIWWGNVNIPISPAGYARNRKRAIDFFNHQSRLFVIDGYAGWDEEFRMKCRIIATRPYHALFMKQMLIRAPLEQLERDFKSGVDFTVMNAGEFNADPTTENVTSETSVAVNFSDREMTILGTQYAGEMKKGIFGVMHYYMPSRGALSMHASANEGRKGDTTLLFGLSGTGKTTLSADPKRPLIGDDEHVWTDKGIFNIEGGCYAKCVHLSRATEPEIFDAVRYGAVLENVKYFPDRPRTVNYDDISICENTRACYPLENMHEVKLPAIGGHPHNIIFLCCDSNGVLPPVAKLTREQSMYHFISGYTAKVAGTEMGIKEPVPSFSACFGEAFLPLHPFTYAKMLAERVEKSGANVWLINSGWSGGMYGVGKRMSLKVTRAILDAIHEGELERAEFQIMPGFNLQVPKTVSNVDPSILMPINTWSDKTAYKQQLKKLAGQFIKNMEKYADGVPKEVISKGGPTTEF
eukprot:TRINITY_DN4357_c1_g1_i8.p2 TRINITY_DN4357_c1_g1~~TRINITY_DN4357_c1_g1_i8.p2  ORF type:complete len:572 (+),score=243.36 TRINITY_DN4357_c1_g1_i8:88-1803(+)